MALEEIENILQSITKLINENKDQYQSIHYRFLGVFDGQYLKMVRGQIVLEASNVTHNDPADESFQESSMGYFSWGRPFPDHYDDLLEELRSGIFKDPKSNQKIRFVTDKGYTTHVDGKKYGGSDFPKARNLSYGYDDSCRYSEPPNYYWQKGGSLSWSGTSIRNIFNKEILSRVEAGLVKRDFGSLKDFVGTKFGWTNFSHGENSAFDLYAPIRVQITSVELSKGKIDVLIHSHESIPVESLTASYQLYDRSNGSEVKARGALVLKQVGKPSKSNPIKILKSTKRVGSGQMVKVALAYKNLFSLAITGYEMEPRLSSASPSDFQFPDQVPSLAPKSMTPSSDKDVFVVHGRNAPAKDAIYDFLTKLGLNPLPWSGSIKFTDEGTPHTDDIVAEGMKNAAAVVVLNTGDDITMLKKDFWAKNDPSYEKEPTLQARPNVLFEAGLAMGQNMKKVVIVELGQLRPMSDLLARNVVKLDDSIKQKENFIARLENAGCAVERKDGWDEVTFELHIKVLTTSDTEKLSTPSSDHNSESFQENPRFETKQVAIATVKKYLDDGTNDIRLNDLLVAECQRICNVAFGEDYRGDDENSANLVDYKKRWEDFELLTNVLRGVFPVIGYWGQPDHIKLAANLLELVGSKNALYQHRSFGHLISLGSLPTLLLAYPLGIGLMASGRPHEVTSLLLNIEVFDYLDKPFPLLKKVCPGNILDPTIFSESFGLGRNPLNPNRHLSKLFRADFSLITPSQNEYDKAFDLWEYWVGMTTYLFEQRSQSGWPGPPGLFQARSIYGRASGRIDYLEKHFLEDKNVQILLSAEIVSNVESLKPLMLEYKQGLSRYRF